MLKDAKVLRIKKSIQESIEASLYEGVEKKLYKFEDVGRGEGMQKRSHGGII